MDRLRTDIRDDFKEKLDHQFPMTSFETIWKKNGVKNSTRFPKLRIIIVLISIFLTTTAFTCYQLIWSHANITTSKEDSDFTNYVTPLEIFDNMTSEIPGTKTVDLFDSRKIANFPIRQPNLDNSWTKIQSIGIIQPVSTSNADSDTTVTDGPLFYQDIYINKDGNRIVVQQRYDKDMSESQKGNNNGEYTAMYPKGSKVLKNFGTDLAVLMDLQKRRFQLQILHKEDNNRVTRIDIWGNTQPDVIENFAQQYLSAPYN